MSINPRKSIRRKVTKRVIVAVIIMGVVLSVVNMVYMYQRIMDEQRQEIELVTNLCAEQIDSWLTQKTVLTNNIADTLVGLKTLDETTVKSILNQVAYTNGELYYVYLGTEEGDIYMARGVQFATGMDPRERPWYTQAKAAGHTIITDPYQSATNKDIILATAATPIYFGTTMVGVVAVDFDITTINNYVSSINFKDGSYGFLIDSQNNIIAHPNSDFLPTTKKSVTVEEAIPEISELIANPGTDVKITQDYSGQSMVYYIEKFSDYKWIIGVAYPESNIYKHIDKAVIICALMALICILIAAFDMTRAIKKILLPIDKINPSVDRVMAGDFDTRIDISVEEDELGELQNKLAVLIKFVSDVIESEKYVLGEMEKGNLTVEDLPEYPGEINEISIAVNSIKEHFNDIISDIQFSALNLQSFAMGINETSDLEEMKLVFEELSAEANNLMDKTSKFTTMSHTQETAYDDDKIE